MGDYVNHHDVGVQVAAKRGKNKGSQTETSTAKYESVATQCGEGEGSYQRKKSGVAGHWTYDRLNKEVLFSKSAAVNWLMERNLICKRMLCPQCSSEMKLVECDDRSDGCKWECGRLLNGKRHKVEMSVRKGSWFECSNLTLEEILKLTYWWCRDVSQETMRFEVDVSGNTVVQCRSKVL